MKSLMKKLGELIMEQGQAIAVIDAAPHGLSGDTRQGQKTGDFFTQNWGRKVRFSTASPTP
jgi:hypothetical protein